MQNPSYKKILFSDIDETLVTTDKRLTDENRAAIAHFLDTGNALAVSTGRALAGALHLMENRTEGHLSLCLQWLSDLRCICRQNPLQKRT